ncbi:MAG TPA: hypothetical protein VMV69_07170 [Pirellulales bacterium]|nr:hypothetical protein [Pirellulales bacterium]
MSARCLMIAASLGALFVSVPSVEAQYGYGMGMGIGMGMGMGMGRGLGGWSPGGILMGMGQYDQLTSRSAINYQQAYSMALDNRLKYEQTYFQMRRQNASDRAAMAAARPHFTPEQYAADNRARIPNKLSPSEWDPGRGVFAWPPILGGDEFANDRTQIEALFGARDADPNQAGLGTDNYRQIRRAVTMMSDHLHSLIDQMSPDEYIPASRFLKNLEYAGRFAPGAEMASAK